MIAAVRPQADFLRQNEQALNDAPFRADVVLYSPFERWVKTDQCATSAVAAALTKDNIQYRVVSEADFDSFAQQKTRPVLLAESRSVFTWREQPALTTIEKQGPGMVVADQPDWLQQLRRKIGKPSVTVTGPPNIRAVVHDQGGRTVVHLYNLNVQRLSSFDDKVTPATNIGLEISAPATVRAVNIRTADASGTSGPLQFRGTPEGNGTLVVINIPRLDISSIILTEP